MDFASQNLTAGQLNAIVKKLGGEEGALRFLRDELTVGVATRVFPIWKSIKLGLHKNDTALRDAIESAGMKIGNWGGQILRRTATATEETDVDLVVASVAELGFKKGAKYSEICARALELGLELCPAEVGPALRLAYKDQPRGEWLIIAMEAITGSGGGLDVFYVGRGVGGLWLRGSGGRPDRFWGSGGRFVFVRRK